MGPAVTGPGSGGTGEVGAAGLEACAQAFLDAVVWGRHTTIWDLLSTRGREAVLAVAVGQGMDRVAAGRLREGLADPAERDRFLGQLLEGLRRDLRSVDLDRLRLGASTDPPSGDEVTIELVVPSTIPGTGAWSAGQLVLGFDGDRGWRVDRLEPRRVIP